MFQKITIVGRRFISTCVEQTLLAGLGVIEHAVHLHVRGADRTTYAASAIHVGSSPRAWSRRLALLPAKVRGRFISTCVEQTCDDVDDVSA